jgi:uncharacterized membrane protein YsdA (DUF1294 family)
MSDFTITLSGIRLHWSAILLAVVLLQWVIFVIISLVSRAKAPKSGMRPSERKLVVSTLVLAVAYGVVFHAETLLPKSRTKAAEAAVIPGSSGGSGSCASVDLGTSAAVVRAKLGQPNEVRSDEKVRGPGAVTWLYRDARCAVHMIEDKVEFVD